MRVAVSATSGGPDAEVDPRFGRCPSFVVVETDDMSCEVLENRSGSLGSGAGIQAARFMAQNAVRAVLTGSVGPNAHEALTAAGIEVVVGCSGTVSDAVARFRSGELRPTAEPNASGHSGRGGGRRRR